jgi:DNA-binding NarL/FixJ family response regulator
VLLVDDHAMVRQGMAEMLSTDEGIEVVAEAADGREAVELAGRKNPDVVILDVEMPVMGGQVALRRLLDLSPPPRVVIVTVFADEFHVKELLGLGASAYLSKNAPMRDLISTVRSVARVRGGPEENGVILHVPRRAFESYGPGESSLSGRETEILLLAARALSNREIGKTLHLSETTVKRHLSNVYAKLDVHTRAEATRKAIHEGLISASEVSRED